MVGAYWFGRPSMVIHIIRVSFIWTGWNVGEEKFFPIEIPMDTSQAGQRQWFASARGALRFLDLKLSQASASQWLNFLLVIQMLTQAGLELGSWGHSWPWRGGVPKWTEDPMFGTAVWSGRESLNLILMAWSQPCPVITRGSDGHGDLTPLARLHRGVRISMDFPLVLQVAVRWNDVSYISMPMVCILCAVAYPAVLVGALLGMTVLLG